MAKTSRTNYSHSAKGEGFYDPESDTMVLDSEIGKRLQKHDDKDWSWDELINQVQSEWQIAYDHQNARKARDLLRLQLYNNQQRAPDKAGDVTMFATHQTLLASLYTDVLEQEFVGREEGDRDVAKNLTAMSEYDNELMETDMLDFFWDWDSLAFGRGLLDMTTYIREPEEGIFCPAPEVLDPCTFLRDPRGVSANGMGLQRRNALRFYGREIRMTQMAIYENEYFFKDIDWGTVKYEDGSTVNSLMDKAAQARAQAQGDAWVGRSRESDLGVNAEYTLTEWYTHYRNRQGEYVKVRVWLANNRSVLVGYQELGKSSVLWGLIDRPLYPHSHDWNGTSVWDLTEDKQRLRAVAQNLGLEAMMADLYPMYAYDTNKITSRKDLRFGFNKFVPVNGDPNSGLAPMRKASPNLPLLGFLYESLDRSSQVANATPEIQQGVTSGQERTLGELNLVANRVNTRYSLSTKVFGWSEKRKWQRWYWMHKEYFDEGIDKKVVRLEGAMGTEWRPLTKDNFICHLDPDVKVQSKIVTRQEQLEERQSSMIYIQAALSDPMANRRYALKEMGRTFGFEADQLDRLFPPTLDEMQAEEENGLLNDGKAVQVFSIQNHMAHLEIHAKAKPSKERDNHIETHKKAMQVAAEEAAKSAMMAPAGEGGTIPVPAAGVSAGQATRPDGGVSSLSSINAGALPVNAPANPM